MGHAAAASRLVVTGSSTVAPLLTEIARRYQASHPDVRVDVQTGGSGRGIGDARQGLADIGMVSRELKPDEGDLHAFGIARDGICLIVNRVNPVASLTDEQVRAIYTGKVSSWAQLGGNPVPITVIHKAEGRSTNELFVSYFKLKPTDVRAHIVIGDNAQAFKTVVANPGAVGYVSIGAAESEAGAGMPIKLLPMSGVAATTEAVRLGKFPISRTLNLVTRKPPEGAALDLIELARSPAVRDLVEDLRFVPLVR